MKPASSVISGIAGLPESASISALLSLLASKTQVCDDWTIVQPGATVRVTPSGKLIVPPPSAWGVGTTPPPGPVLGGLGWVDGPLNTTAVVTPAASITTTTMIAATTPPCNRCSTGPTSGAASTAVCSAVRVAKRPAPASTNATSVGSARPRKPEGTRRGGASSYR